jgi:hypothetical protein
LAGVVGAEGLEFKPQGRLAHRVEEALDRGEIQMLAADHQSAALGSEGDEIEAEGARGRTGGDTTIGQAGADGCLTVLGGHGQT